MSSQTVEERPDLSIVVPLYNEEASVRELVARVATTLAARPERYEIVLVDDGSTDGTAAALREVARDDPRLRIYSLSRNFGQSAALCCGLFESRGEIVVTLDGDLQNPPEEIPALLAAFAPGVDVVTARRAVRHEKTWRWLGSRLVHQIARALVGVDIQDYGGQFKAYRRGVIDATRTAWSPGKPFFALALSLGFRVVEVPVRHDPRRFGESRYDFTSLVRLNLDIITSFTTLPLALLALLSLLCGGVGAIAALLQLRAGGPFGFGAALSLLLLGLAGVFFATALLGLYLARVYRTVAGPRLGYVVRAEEPRPDPHLRA